MSRLIDADELALKLRYMGYMDEHEEVQEVIDNAPTIDVVEVVWCENCRHANECHKSVQYTRNELYTVAIGFLPIEWCSRGERKKP